MQKRKKQDFNRVLQRVDKTRWLTVMTYLQSLDCARSLTIVILIRDFLSGGTGADEIANLTVNPYDYNDVDSFRKAHQATELIRKCNVLPVSWDPEERALEKFLEAEQQCSATNSRLRTRSVETSYHTQILARARGYISSLLGPVDADTLAGIGSNGGWGKGVTSSAKGKWLSEYHKLEATPQATRSFLPLAQALWSEVLCGLSDVKVEGITGSRVAFVPKDARAHRTIAVEPSVNMYAQKACGLAIRDRLRKKWGLNLNSQLRNQQLAHRGSRDNDLATIDLSSASDTVSIAIVERLLPDDWLALLNSVRCTFTEVNGKTTMLAKWSSMGNGYTFELETLIFSALVRAVISPSDWYENNWAVYGDDIIVPTSSFGDLCEVLEYCGFSLNKRKTYNGSPFRESCGADYFYGEKVRPFLLKSLDGLNMMNWANWLYDSSYNWCRVTWDLIVWDLGPSFPRLSDAQSGVGLLTYGILPVHESAYTVCRRGRLGRLYRYLEWQPDSLTSKNVDGVFAVVARLRLIMAMRDPYDSVVKLRISESWRITARESGKWVTKTGLKSS